MYGYMNYNDKKVLIVYYSYEGNTEFVAESIQKKTNGDMLRLELSEQKDRVGLSKYLWGGSQVMMGKKPQLKKIDVDIKEYDLIFLGSPIWAGRYAPAFNTYLANLEGLNDKEFALFCCHGGGGGNKAFAKVKSKLSGNDFLTDIAFLDPKKNLDREEMDNQVEAWLESNE